MLSIILNPFDSVVKKKHLVKLAGRQSSKHQQKQNPTSKLENYTIQKRKTRGLSSN